MIDEERITEQVDLAAKLQDDFNNRGIARAAAAVAPESDPDFDGKHCLDCPTIIPKARRDLGRIRCVACQTIKEKHQKGY